MAAPPPKSNRKPYMKWNQETVAIIREAMTRDTEQERLLAAQAALRDAGNPNAALLYSVSQLQGFRNWQLRHPHVRVSELQVPARGTESHAMMNDGQTMYPKEEHSAEEKNGSRSFFSFFFPFLEQPED